MDQCATGEMAARIVRETKIKPVGIDYKRLAIYLFLTIGQIEMIKLGLSDVIPTRMDTDKQNESRSLLGRNNRDLNNWFVDSYMITEDIKREMIAQMLQVATLVMMSSTCYSFGGEIFLQKVGAGIGLRGSAALAKATMGIWDTMWAALMHSWKFLVKLYIRYIDDVRVFAHPIKKGWSWNHDGWTFNENAVDDRDPITRTREELQKAFDSIMDFLLFTTECEPDFSSGYLPTLDVEMQAQSDGSIWYRFYSKPTNNNIVIQRNTALSQDTIFSSLRQEVVRRMTNTCEYISLDTRLKVIEDMIQLMRNSDHKYAFIKSVILQGLTKYEYMKRRSLLQETHAQFMPLHRPKDFRGQERLLTKYVNIMLWYKDFKVGDPFKQTWKRRIRYKNDKQKSSFRKDSKTGETTTTFFVPPSAKSLLFKLVVEKERLLRKKFGWWVKILEAPGSPLLSRFASKFPISEGCPRGDNCILCEGKGVKCSVKSVVYQATCRKCLHVIAGVNDEHQLSEGTITLPIYVGETSRPWRERVLEHCDGMLNCKASSVFVEHWMEHHGLDTICPEFKFEIVSTYPDPLRRQLSEALNIQDRGTMNRKLEYNKNEICRLEATMKTKDQEKLWREEFDNRKLLREKLNNFCNVMSTVNKTPVADLKVKLCDSNEISTSCDLNHSCSRYQVQLDSPVRKKIRIMETSTPLSNREAYRELEREQVSPISSPPCGRASADSLTSVEASGAQVSPTKISGGMAGMQVTPPKAESESTEERKLAHQGLSLTWAATVTGIIKKTRSLPDLIQSVRENELFKPYVSRVKSPDLMSFRGRSRSFGDLSSSMNPDASQWSNGDFEKISNNNAVSDVSDEKNLANGLQPNDDSKMISDDDNNLVSNVKNSADGLQSNCETVKISNNNDVSDLVVIKGEELGGGCESFADPPDLVVSRRIAKPKRVLNAARILMDASKDSAVKLGQGSSVDIHNQVNTPRSSSLKRSRVSPESTIGKFRRLSINEQMMSPTLRDPPVMNIRSSQRNTPGRKISSRIKFPGKDQPLITGIFKKTNRKLEVEQDFGHTGDEVKKEVTEVEKKS